MVTLQVLLPWLKGWEPRCEIKTFKDSELATPFEKGGQPRTIYKFAPSGGRRDFVAWVYGVFTMVTSPYIHVLVYSYGKRRPLICLAPYYAIEFNLKNWQSFAIYVTRVDVSNNVYACNFVPDDPLPISSYVDEMLELRAFLPKTYLDFITRSEKEVPDELAYINYLGVSYYYVYDTEAFLDSWHDLMKRVFGGDFELLYLSIKELVELPRLLKALPTKITKRLIKVLSKTPPKIEAVR